ncbi:hypothetical protein DFH06DRAFT_1225283 [Mycena polygramma]|nr:hypothetical protein DFH06DRAFT_1225283 [Mycena polygramma]
MAVDPEISDTSTEGCSLLEVFIKTARDPGTASRYVLECGDSIWTYAELDTISSGLAEELRSTLGHSPKVAVVSENHPFVFALMLAVWKLSGIFIPIDAHVPATLLAGMVDLVNPTCLFLSAFDALSNSLDKVSKFRVMTFGTEDSTIRALNEKYARSTLDVGISLPHPDHPCLYLFTSSASSVKNLKAVPLTHKIMLSACRSKLAWWRRMRPDKVMDGIRVLGWAPWSHVLAHMQDIGTCTLLNAGCYVFVSEPLAYHPGGPSDLTSLVVDGILNKGISAFSCLPFVLGGLKAACEGARPDKMALLHALRHMTMLECGGAMLDREVSDWAVLNGIPLMVGTGMTETAGAIFAGSAKEVLSGFSPQGLISDAQFSVIGDRDEGELVVKSKLLPHGYINYDDGSFSVDDSGWVTFKTGDRYRRTGESKFKWLGRTSDYIQMASGEYVDPRPLENSLRSYEFIENACVIGDSFLRGASTAIWAIVELAGDHLEDPNAAKIKVARALAPINRDLPPALRIASSSVLILNGSQKIPQTKKGEVFRKQIEDSFAASMHAMRTAANDIPGQEDAVMMVVGNVLGVSDLDILMSMSFAELGMTSVSAIRIANELNEHLDGRVVLPSNICYLHLDIPSLRTAVQNLLLQDPAIYRIPERPATPIADDTTDEIVIVGKAYRLPGGTDNDCALWDALLGKHDTVISAISPDRWDHASFFPRDICFEKAGLLDLASFDYSFFGLNATEAFYVSPTMRIALEVAFEALENANMPISQVRGSKMGVFVATKDDGFETLLNAGHGFDAYTRFYGTGRAPSTASGRISYLLDIHGPSLTIDTACSGGLVCMDQAVSYLKSGAAESAIVCSSNTHCWPGSFMFLTAQGMVSPNSRCAAFTAEANGYVPSEGAVAFVLKTRSAANRDRDMILAIIKATEVSHNGRSQGLVAPNVKSQAALHRSLLGKAHLDPSLINFVEAHGTGTSLGDLCEIQGINEAFVSDKQRDPLIISASKGAIGHTEPSAGLVGILSVLMSFEKSLIPGLVHLREDNANAMLDCIAVPLLLPLKPVKLQGPKPYRAVVMSYGFSGTLADILMESSQEPPSPPEPPRNSGPMMFVVSAKTSHALSAYIALYLAFLRNVDAGKFYSICYTSCVGREHYKHRFACVATDLTDLVRQLELWAPAHSKRPSSQRSLAFIFPGQGTQFPGMAAPLAATYSRFQELIETFGRKAHAVSGYPIHRILLGDIVQSENQIHSDVDQICIFIYQYSMVLWLKELGIEPQAVLGHSFGEITGAVVAGGLLFDTALDLVVTRARLLRPSRDNPGGMAALACSQTKISSLLDGLDSCGDISVSVLNGPQNICVSGAREDIDKLVATAKQQNMKATRLPVDQGFHSNCVESAMNGMRTWSEHNSTVFQPLHMTLYSTLLGAPVLKGKIPDHDHWVDHARKPVLFSQAAATIQQDHSIGATLDIGPQRVASSLLLLNGYSGGSVAVSAKRGEDQEVSLLSALAALYQHHQIIPDFRMLYSQRRRGIPLVPTSIPTYPFQRVRCYSSYIPSRRENGETGPTPGEIYRNTVTPEFTEASTAGVTSEQMRELLKACLREVLEISPSHLDESEPLVCYGVDSIMFASLRKRIGDQYGLNLSVLFWSDAFPISSLINNLLEQYAEKHL